MPTAVKVLMARFDDGQDGLGHIAATRVAAFDFDGTLTYIHTMVRFLIRTHGLRRVLVVTCRALMHSRSRDQLKITVVGALFKGMPYARCEMLGERYAHSLRAHLRPAAIERLRWHQKRGDTTVIVSASLNLYLRPVARDLDIDDVLGVELMVDECGRFTGLIVHDANNRGPEKVVRLAQWMRGRFGAGTDLELWAYGDDAGDREMLNAADHPVWVHELGV